MLSEREWRDFSSGEDPARVSKDRYLYDSRIEVGTVGPVVHKFFSEAGERREYFCTKFAYYLTVLRLKLTDPAAMPPSGPPPVPPDVLDRWGQEFAPQAKAYVLRYLQSPPEVVKATWYNDTAELQAWADETIRALRAEPHGAFATWLQFPVCLEEEFEIHDWVSDGARQVSALSADTHLALGASLSRQPRMAAAIRKTFDDLHALVERGESEYKHAMGSILSAMQSQFGVEICDYLQVKHANATQGGLLDFIATTTDHSIEKLEEGEPAYGYAGGITGSAFLARNDVVGGVLLTSVLDLDPRQSEKHRKLWTNAYGTIDNFCIVPVFDGDGLIGVFRLINRQDEISSSCCGGKRGLWPLDHRIELVSLAAWLSGTMRTLRLTLEASPDPALAAAVANPGWLTWAPLKARAALLRDLAQVASMRDEHRTVSAALFAGSKQSCDDFIGSHRRFDGDVEGNLTQANRWFGRLLPGGGVFVSDVEVIRLEGRVRYRSVVNTGQLSFFDAVQVSARHPKSCLLYADGERGVVHCYEGDTWSADYFLDEKTGRWRMRSRVVLEAQLEGWWDQNRLESRSFVDLVLSQIIPHSYTGHGGLIVVSDDNPRDDTVRFGFEVNSLFSEMDRALFQRVVAVDGGTWIALDGRVERGGLIFGSEVRLDEDAPGGARHQVARALVNDDPDRVVIAISANRPISLFANGVDELSI